MKSNSTEKKMLVQKVFNKVFDKYDLMNDIMSLGSHRLWKKQMVNWLSPSKNTILLDMASGTGDIAKWKTNVRRFTLSVTGYNKIECLINNSLLSLNKIDSELTSMSNLQINDSVKFTPIKKAFDDLDLLINNTNKNMNNFFSGFIKYCKHPNYDIIIFGDIMLKIFLF